MLMPVGRSPMSARKFSKVFHLSQTDIPLPPYRSKLMAFLYEQRFIMAHQLFHVGVFVLPCLVTDFSRFVIGSSARRHPQDLLLPDVMPAPCISFSVPHSHLHSQRVLDLLLTFLITVQRPYFMPVMSMSFVMSSPIRRLPPARWAGSCRRRWPRLRGGPRRRRRG